MSMSTKLLIILLATCSVTKSSKQKNGRLIHQFDEGLRFAKEYLGMESAALTAANLVLRAFKPLSTKPQAPITSTDQTESLSPLRNLVRLFGLQPSQVSAVAVNALIFLAQMIATFLSGSSTHPSRLNKEISLDTPAKWILEKKSDTVQKLLSLAKNESLPEIVINIIEENAQGEETSCIKLLICKITPIVWKMQNSVFSFNQEETSQENIKLVSFGRHLPTKEEMSMYGDTNHSPSTSEKFPDFSDNSENAKSRKNPMPIKIIEGYFGFGANAVDYVLISFLYGRRLAPQQ